VSKNTTANIVFCIAVVILLVGYFVFGPRHGFDSASYRSFGDVVLDWVFRDIYVGIPMRDHVLIPNYILPAFLIGSCYEIFGSYGHQAAIGLNIVLFAFCVKMLIQIWRILGFEKDQPLAFVVFLSLFLCFGLIDTPLWVYYDLTDIIFLFYVTLFLFFIIKGMKQQSSSFVIFSLFLALFGYFVRPTAMVLPVIWLLFMSLLIYKKKFNWFGYLTIACVCLGTLTIILGFPAIVDIIIDNRKLIKDWPQFLTKAATQSRVFYEYGWVVADRPETFVLNPQGYWDYLEITLKRLFYYFSPFRSGYSLIHSSINAMYLLVTLPLAGFGIVTAWKQSDENKRFVVVIITTSLLFGLMHAITLNSYDWRYQLPAMIPLWILAGIGGLRINSKYTRR